MVWFLGFVFYKWYVDVWWLGSGFFGLGMGFVKIGILKICLFLGWYGFGIFYCWFGSLDFSIIWWLAGNEKVKCCIGVKVGVDYLVVIFLIGRGCMGISLGIEVLKVLGNWCCFWCYFEMELYGWVGLCRSYKFLVDGFWFGIFDGYGMIV